MTMTEIATMTSAAPALTAKIEYARFLATSGLLPPAYRQNPGNILFAYEYGELLGLPPIAAITGIHVIEGKPSVSAGLISALVRRAGHRLRVQGDEIQANAWITRADDPSFTYRSVWTMDRAKTAGLLSKTNWQRYPAAMLKARAISEVARDACQEVLLGIAYTPDELGADDDGGEVIHDGWPTRGGIVDPSQMTEGEKDAAGLMTRAQRVQHDALRRMGEPPAGAVQITREPDPEDPWAGPEPPPKATASKPASEAALKRMNDLIGQIGLGPDEDIEALIRWITGGTGHELTGPEVRNVTTLLADALETAGGDTDKAAAEIWAQYKRMNPQAGEDSA
jgi:hypothetical protein